jgi:hypothetical protein
MPSITPDLAQKIDCAWVIANAPGATRRITRGREPLGGYPLIPLPNSDRDDGCWYLGIDNKHEGTTVLLYCELPGDKRVYRKLAVIQERYELIRLYESLVGEGTWERNRG